MTPAQSHRDSLRRFGCDVPPTPRRRQFWEPRRRCAADDCGFGTTVSVCATASTRSGRLLIWKRCSTHLPRHRLRREQRLRHPKAEKHRLERADALRVRGQRTECMAIARRLGRRDHVPGGRELQRRGAAGRASFFRAPARRLARLRPALPRPRARGVQHPRPGSSRRSRMSLPANPYEPTSCGPGSGSS